MAEHKEEGKKCAYDCRDEGFDCDWQCVADDEDQLAEKVRMHANIHHNIWNLSRDSVSQYPEDQTPGIEE